MRHILPIFLLLPAAPAAAHVGHVAEVAGHGHWIGLAAIGLAAAIGLLSAKGKKEEAADAEEQDAEAEEQPA